MDQVIRIHVLPEMWKLPLTPLQNKYLVNQLVGFVSHRFRMALQLNAKKKRCLKWNDSWFLDEESWIRRNHFWSWRWTCTAVTLQIHQGMENILKMQNVKLSDAHDGTSTVPQPTFSNLHERFLFCSGRSRCNGALVHCPVTPALKNYQQKLHASSEGACDGAGWNSLKFGANASNSSELYSGDVAMIK